MRCPNCGEELFDDALFCRECGCKIPKEPQKRFCRECGSKLEEGSKFCSMCGAKVLTQNDLVQSEETDIYEDESADDVYAGEVLDSVKLSFADHIELFWNQLDGFTKACSVTGLVLVFAFLIAWLADKPLAILASLAQIGCLVVFYLIRNKTIKVDKLWIIIALPLLIALLSVGYVNGFGSKDTTSVEDSVATVETIEPTETTVVITAPSTETVIETTEYILADDEIRLDFSNYGLISENYEDVTYRLNRLGFTDISYRVQYDIIFGITKEGSVASVSIAGISKYSKGDIFKVDDPVVITYHLKTDKDPNREVDETVKETTEYSMESVTETTQEVTESSQEEIITIDNNEDFRTLMTSNVLDPTAQSNFALKYKNRIIEFDGFVYYMEQNKKYDTMYSYIFVPGESDNITGAVMFGLEDANFVVFKWDSKTRPSYLTIGSKIRMRAEIQGVSDIYIKIKPVCTWGR